MQGVFIFSDFTPFAKEIIAQLGIPDYQVSNLGNVRGPRGLRKPIKATTGYLVITFHRFGRHFKRTIHSLVCEAFIGPRPDGLQVLHDDDDKTNNKLSNLSYGTHRENTVKANKQRREFSEDTIRFIRSTDYSLRKLAKAFGVSKGLIQGIKDCCIYTDIN